jgi:hypothetical protein
MYIIYRDLIGPPRKPDLPRDVEVQLDNARIFELELKREKAREAAAVRRANWTKMKATIVKAILG